jgi:hypothetical protein
MIKTLILGLCILPGFQGGIKWKNYKKFAENVLSTNDTKNLEKIQNIRVVTQLDASNAVENLKENMKEK